MKKKMNQCLKRIEAILKKKTSNHNNKTSLHNKTSSHNNMVFQTFSLDMKANIMRTFKALRKPSKIWQEQEKLAKEIQEVRRSQLAQAVAKNQRLEAKRNMQLALERQGRDNVGIRKQVNLWTNNVSSKEAYACWAQ
ncbi:hypothetical protein PIB30_097621 [Stylosanthes scabra]|uniref:Remorin C-terminal domain-containing protein n=1 Tax=Stylosanthes scabra TaxID=79078 RepID=A0ABU6ZV47_9FABA|nr:hypothetical protein [Stylosanthes scabra]